MYTPLPPWIYTTLVYTTRVHRRDTHHYTPGYIGGIPTVIHLSGTMGGYIPLLYTLGYHGWSVHHCYTPLGYHGGHTPLLYTSRVPWQDTYHRLLYTSRVPWGCASGCYTPLGYHGRLPGCAEWPSFFGRMWAVLRRVSLLLRVKTVITLRREVLLPWVIPYETRVFLTVS